MKLRGSISLAACLLLLLALSMFSTPILRAARTPAPTGATPSAAAAASSWYFAVSGDSRDCGDLIMPKIAQSVRDRQAQAPSRFYWHLGDFRALYRVDCDMAKRGELSLGNDANFDCLPEHRTSERLALELNAAQKRDYQARAWDDFIKYQVNAFETPQQAGAASIPVVLGIGNHELIDHTREDYRLKFQKWMTQPLLAGQVKADAKRRVMSDAGATYFHFVERGVDFIYLDNASGDASFSRPQIEWLRQVLAADARDRAVKTIIVGMHAALPFSISRNHAMDASCPGICSGQEVYNLLFDAQNLAASSDRRKHVYVLASHSHYFEQNIYDTPEHFGRVLPGWIIGTAGAEQYRDTIAYGYLQVEVRGDGTINPQFIQVTRDSPPAYTEGGAAQLVDFCFGQNKKPVHDNSKKDCSCGVQQ